jgi:hypothetical protein
MIKMGGRSGAAAVGRFAGISRFYPPRLDDAAARWAARLTAARDEARPHHSLRVSLPSPAAHPRSVPRQATIALSSNGTLRILLRSLGQHPHSRGVRVFHYAKKGARPDISSGTMPAHLLSEVFRQPRPFLPA